MTCLQEFQFTQRRKQRSNAPLVQFPHQTTDKKVNEVTPELFAMAPDAAAMAAADVAAIQATIRQLGLAPTKAKNLKAMAAALLEHHGAAVPSSFEELEALPGVGHKTARFVELLPSSFSFQVLFFFSLLVVPLLSPPPPHVSLHTRFHANPLLTLPVW
jgi:hypothetical protein